MTDSQTNYHMPSAHAYWGIIIWKKAYQFMLETVTSRWKRDTKLCVIHKNCTRELVTCACYQWTFVYDSTFSTGLLILIWKGSFIVIIYSIVVYAADRQSMLWITQTSLLCSGLKKSAFWPGTIILLKICISYVELRCSDSSDYGFCEVGFEGNNVTAQSLRGPATNGKQDLG